MASYPKTKPKIPIWMNAVISDDASHKRWLNIHSDAAISRTPRLLRATIQLPDTHLRTLDFDKIVYGPRARLEKHGSTSAGITEPAHMYLDVSGLS